MLRRYASATLSMMLAALAYGAGTTDSLTGLPLPDAASALSLGSAMKLNPAQVCKSTWTQDFYSPSGGKTSAAIAWYAAHLKGFHHLHGYGANRTQDALVNADGSLMVIITGSPAADGTDTDTYAITYTAVKPGLSQKTLLGMLTQHVAC